MLFCCAAGGNHDRNRGKEMTQRGPNAACWFPSVDWPNLLSSSADQAGTFAPQPNPGNFIYWTIVIVRTQHSKCPN